MSKTDKTRAESPVHNGVTSNFTTMPYQCQELVLYGSLKTEHLENLERRLSGLCDPGVKEFQEHELTFSLKTGVSNATTGASSSDVTVRLRRVFHFDSFNSNNTHKWHVRYLGAPEPDQKCPVVVRKVIDSVLFSHNMMEFVKSLGLRMDYEFITKGKVYTNGKMKVVINEIRKTEKAGTYDQSMLKNISDSLLIEMSVCLPDSLEYMTAAKQLRDFADQLLPLVCMEKIDYWRK